MVVEDRDLQRRDVDVVWYDGEEKRPRLVSVKMQPGLPRYGNVAFELELIEAGTGARRPGNWATSAAEDYAIVSPDYAKKVEGVWTSVVKMWYFNSATLRAVVDQPSKGWPEKRTMTKTNARNEGLVHSGALCRLVPFLDIECLARWAKEWTHEEALAPNRPPSLRGRALHQG